MPNIEVIEQWDDIYQLETTDPVQGGADGVDNLPHKNLANRTLWLKNNKADKNGNSVNKFQVANGTAANDAVNKSQLDSKASVVGSDIQTFKVANAIANDEAVNLGQLNTKINISDIQDILDSTNTNKPLSANQGRILKGLIDNLNTILLSDDTTLDELQEIVNFIKQNKTTLDTLAISNIAGLPDALATKPELGGSATQEYKVADATADNEAVNKKQLDTAISSQLSGFKNLIINGCKRVNQRGASSIDKTANAYNLDRWYYDGTNFIQFIEDKNVVLSGVYTLSWDGTATAMLDGVSIANGGQVTLTANTQIEVKFNSSDFNLVQLEYGNKKTNFEIRPYSLELDLCKRYMEIIKELTFSGYSNTHHANAWTTTYVEKRVIPSISTKSINYQPFTNPQVSATYFIPSWTIQVTGFTSTLFATGSGMVQVDVIGIEINAEIYPI